MEGQRFSVGGRVFEADDAGLQDALAEAHDAPVRPRCLCVEGGVEMYVACHGQYLVKRMPETGPSHHPSCPSYEPEAACSGLAELLGEAIVQVDPDHVELRVGFAWDLGAGKTSSVAEAPHHQEVARPRRRMSLRALLHFLFDRAGLNRWTPGMSGKRNQAVVHKYLMRAAEGVTLRGRPLVDRMYVPEPFSESRKRELAERRRRKLAVLQPRNGCRPLGVVVGEFKTCEATVTGKRMWIRHMPDAPLVVEAGTWRRMQKVFAAVFEARDAAPDAGLRIVIAALIRARDEGVYEVEAATFMLATAEWIPLHAACELPLVRTLVEEGRQFVKPMIYDAPGPVGFANALLLDVGALPIQLHISSAFMSEKERQFKDRLVAAAKGGQVWHWWADEGRPVLPGRTPPRTGLPTWSGADHGCLGT